MQLPIDIPQIPRSVLYEKTNEHLIPILHRNGISEESPEALRAREVINHSVMPYLKTMRDYKRFFNAFNFEFSYLEKNISVVDLIALVSLKQFAPEVITWIDTHLPQLCGASKKSFVPSEASEFRNAVIEEICKAINNNRKKAESAVDTLMNMFPRFACSCGSLSEDLTLEQMKMTGRVASEEVYLHYRTSSLGLWGYPRETIRALLSEASRKEIADSLDTKLANGFDFGEEASGLVGNLPRERAHEIAGGCLDSIIRSQITDERNSYGDRLEQLLYGALTRCGKEDAFSLLSEAIGQSTPEGLVRLSHLINTEELMHGRLAGNTERPNRQLLSLERLLKLESTYARRVREVSGECRLLSMNGARMLLYLWGCFDGEAEKQYIKRSLDEYEYELINLCNLCAGTWRTVGDHGAGVITSWSPNRGAVERYLDLANARETIDRIRMKHAFWDFDDRLLQATAAIYIMIDRGIPRSDEQSTLEVDHSEVLSLIDKWHDEFTEATSES